MTHTQQPDGGAEYGAPIAYLPWVKEEEDVVEPQPVIEREPATLPTHIHVREASDVLSEDRIPRDESVIADELVLPKLARKGLSSGEVRAILLIEVSPQAVDEAIDRYERYGYLDDEKLASELVERLQRRKGLGTSGIRRELNARALPAEVIERALLGAGDETDTAIALAEARMRSLSGLEPETARRRLSAYLQRRGYGSSAISNALAHVFPR